MNDAVFWGVSSMDIRQRKKMCLLVFFINGLFCFICFLWMLL
jgi:hypothetical protein